MEINLIKRNVGLIFFLRLTRHSFILFTKSIVRRDDSRSKTVCHSGNCILLFQLRNHNKLKNKTAYSFKHGYSDQTFDKL